MNSRIILLFISTLFSCRNNPATQEEPTSGLVPDSLTTVSLAAAQQETAEVKFGVLQRRSISNTIKTNGYLDTPPQYRATVTPIMAGYVKNTTLLIGDKVKKGQTLVTLTHPDYVSLQQQYLEEIRQLDYLRSEYERQVELDRDRINAKKNLLKATSDYQAAQARIEGLRERLMMLGLKPESVAQGRISSEIRLTSPLNGYITKVNSTIGKLAPPGEVLFEVVNLDHLHVELKVLERDISRVQVGQPFSFTLTGSDQLNYGEIYLIGKSLEEEDRTIHVHGHPNEDRDYFLPGMYVTGTIYTGADSVWSLPEQAVVSSGQQAYVFKKKSDNSFTKVPVQTGQITEGWIEVMPGLSLKPEDSIAIQGTYYLSAASEMGE
jgi:cobalt-zinc-cadmium efflux system membrane fusion protein